jgi:hypothetical protein
MTFLTTEAFHFSDSKTFNTDVRYGFTDIVKLERLDDGTYEFHGYYPYGVLLHLPIRQENLVPRFINDCFQ